MIAILILFSTSLNLRSSLIFDPSYEWKSIKTEHFWIHYHQGLKDVAQKLSILSEEVHRELVKKIHWKPYLRTDIILVDNMYTANGSATPFPFNRIEIYITRPEIDSLLGNFDDWLKIVFTHEYTHILNLDSVRGFPAVLRYSFGRCCFPNAPLPIWMIEGNAVYHESGYSKFGRNNSAYTDMIMRTEIISDNFKSIGEASTFPRRWPIGRVPYLYGGLFVEFLEKKYGKGSFANVFIDNSYNVLPYYDNIIPYLLPFINSCSENVYRETVLTLWEEWEEYLKIKYQRQISKIKGQELTYYTKITNSGYKTSLPKFSSAGKDLFFIRNTNYNKTALIKFNLQTKEKNVLCRVNSPNSIAVSNTNKIYISDAEYYGSFSIYNEAFVYHEGHEYEQLTSRLRGAYIDISANGNKIIFVKQDKNKYSLIISDYQFSKYNNLITNSDIQFAFTQFSPNGEQIVFTMKDKKGNADIAIMNLSNRNVLRLEHDEYNDIHPVWHPDGNRIIFSSDRNGIYNLYEYNLNKKALSRLTNLLGGTFTPDVSPDGKTIAFVSYSFNGFDIATMKYPEKQLNIKEANLHKLDKNFFVSSDNESMNTKVYEISSFNVFNTLYPPFYFPLISTSEVYEDKTEWVFGIFTLGSDILYHNQYLFNCLAHTFEKRASASLSYMHSSFYPNIILEYYNNTLFFDDDKFPWEEKNPEIMEREMKKYSAAGLALPLNYYRSSHMLSVSYQYSKTYLDIYCPATETAHFSTSRIKTAEAKIRAKYIYSNAGEYAYSISKEDGRDFNLVSDFYSKYLGSDLAYSKIRGEYAEYLPGFSKSNVTMFRLRGGASFNNPDYKTPYTLGRYEKGEIGVYSTGEDEFGLRGYPSGKIKGNRIAASTLEYKFPILQMDLGPATFPLMFRDLWITTFIEGGDVWNDKIKIDEFKSSAGIELNMRITIGYILNLQGYIGYAKGFNKHGEDQIYFAVSSLFEGALKNNYKWLDYL